MEAKDFLINILEDHFKNWAIYLRGCCADDGADDYEEISNDNEKLGQIADFIMEQMQLTSFHFSDLKFHALVKAALEYLENPSIEGNLSKVASLYKATHVGNNLNNIIDDFVKYVDTYNYYNK